MKKLCYNCGKKDNFKEASSSEYCNKVHFFGLSFSGGIRFYTLREILVWIGFKKKAKVYKCSHCTAITIECPYCEAHLESEFGLKEKCKDCEGVFYVCV